MRHLVIGQRQNAPNFSAFHWSPHSTLVSIGQNFVTTRVVHLPKRTETSLNTESDQSGPKHQLSQLCTARTAWSDSDQAVRAVHSCKSWFTFIMMLFHHCVSMIYWCYCSFNNTGTVIPSIVYHHWGNLPIPFLQDKCLIKERGGKRSLRN